MPERKGKQVSVSREITFRNRARLSGAEAVELDLPQIDAGAHLVAHLFDVGPSVAGEVLTFTEIQAWSSMTGAILGAWEAVMLRRLSGVYLSELSAAKDPKRLMPRADPEPD